MRKIGVGTLVSVEQESTGRGRRRPSEGGIGFVVKCKKQRRMEDKNGETPVVELTQQSTTSTTTAGTGATMFDIRYSLDGRLSQEVNKNRVRVGMLGTTARQRNGSREVRPSLLTASTTTTNNNNNNNTSHNNRRSAGLKKYTHQWLLVAMDHKTRDSEQKHIAALQHKKRTESQGWLRRMEAHQVETHQHLSEVEKKKAMDLLLACKPHDSAIPMSFGQLSTSAGITFLWIHWHEATSGMPKWHLHWLLAMEEMILYESVADCTTTSAIAVQRFVERMESQWGLKSSHATTTVRKRKTTTKTTIKNFTTKNLMWRRS